jgi:starch synthase
MACQTAVLASRVGGIPEVVDHGVTGELVNYNEGDISGFEESLTSSITRLMTQPELLTQYGIAGRKRAIAEFGWEAVAARTIELYRFVIQSFVKQR